MSGGDSRSLPFGEIGRILRSLERTHDHPTHLCRNYFGFPNYFRAIGPDPTTQEFRGHARGIIAVGDTAVGVIAVGGFARGVIAVGGVAIGVISVGGATLGLLAVGGLAIGLLAVGGIAIGYSVVGGLVMGQHLAGPIGAKVSITP